MAQALKDIFFQPEFFNKLVGEIEKVYSDFDGNKYLELVFDKDWEKRELKDRMIHAAQKLGEVLPDDYVQALKIIEPVSEKFEGFDAILFCQFVEEFGLDYFDESMKALEITTVEASAEGAIRPFIQKYPDKAMNQMLEWSEHENEHVRRLASEGCRPLLPWNIRLYQFVDDPSPIVPILENLKDDPSEYVRKSVANNLNDISKNQPDMVLDLAEKWFGQSKKTDRIIKHALRTLLKQGNQRALKLFGFGAVDDVSITNLKIDPKEIKIGNQAHFWFDLEIEAKEKKKLRLEYAVYYLKANGSHSKKVFQISEREWIPNKTHTIKRKQSFKNLTTRKHYPGPHKLAIIVNGIEKSVVNFELV